MTISPLNTLYYRKYVIDFVIYAAVNYKVYTQPSLSDEPVTKSWLTYMVLRDYAWNKNKYGMSRNIITWENLLAML